MKLWILVCAGTIALVNYAPFKFFLFVCLFCLCTCDFVPACVLIMFLLTVTPVLYVEVEKTILTSQENNTIECYITNDQQANLSLWNNNRILAHTYGNYLQHQTRPSQFGVFRCQADNVSNSSLILERGKSLTLCTTNFVPITPLRQCQHPIQLFFHKFSHSILLLYRFIALWRSVIVHITSSFACDCCRSYMLNVITVNIV